MFNDGLSSNGTTPIRVMNGAQGSWHLHNMAMSNYTGQTPFSRGCNNGLCMIQKPGKSDYMVQVWTCSCSMSWGACLIVYNLNKLYTANVLPQSGAVLSKLRLACLLTCGLPA